MISRMGRSGSILMAVILAAASETSAYAMPINLDCWMRSILKAAAVSERTILADRWRALAAKAAKQPHEDLLTELRIVGQDWLRAQKVRTEEPSISIVGRGLDDDGEILISRKGPTALNRLAKILDEQFDGLTLELNPVQQISRQGLIAEHQLARNRIILPLDAVQDAEKISPRLIHEIVHALVTSKLKKGLAPPEGARLVMRNCGEACPAGYESGFGIHELKAFVTEVKASRLSAKQAKAVGDLETQVFEEAFLVEAEAILSKLRKVALARVDQFITGTQYTATQYSLDTDALGDWIRIRIGGDEFHVPITAAEVKKGKENPESLRFLALKTLEKVRTFVKETGE